MTISIVRYMSHSKKVLVLAGPTGVGKTLIATCISKLLEGELVSCDSVQVFDELYIQLYSV